MVRSRLAEALSNRRPSPPAERSYLPCSSEPLAKTGLRRSDLGLVFTCPALQGLPLQFSLIKPGVASRAPGARRHRAFDVKKKCRRWALRRRWRPWRGPIWLRRGRPQPADPLDFKYKTACFAAQRASRRTQRKASGCQVGGDLVVAGCPCGTGGWGVIRSGLALIGWNLVEPGERLRVAAERARRARQCPLPQQPQRAPEKFTRAQRRRRRLIPARTQAAWG